MTGNFLYNLIHKRWIILLFVAFLVTLSEAQVKTPQGWYHEPVPHKRFRVFLSKINLEVSTGLGRTYYTHKPEGMAVYSGSQGVRLLQPSSYDPNTGNISGGLDQWFHTATQVGGWTASGTDRVIAIDTTKLKFRSKSTSIPLNAAIFFRIDRFKFGGGFDFEPQLIASFRPTKYENTLNSFKTGPKLVFIRKYYGMLGASIYRYQNFIFSGDVRIGAWNPGRKFNLGLIDKSLFYNIGAAVEWELSEYFMPFVRGSFEFKNYMLSIPESPGTIKHRANQTTINIGVYLRIPELPKCFIKTCRAQMNHQHGDREYRSRVHPIWKKQNPNYGENYPTLFKYKRRNRKKLNAY